MKITLKTFTLLLLIVSIFSRGFSQGRPINKLTLETTYSYTQIHKAIRDIVDQPDKSSYFDDEFFNSMLKKILTDKQFTEKERVQIFYLMQKKLGFAFIGVSYLPPKQNYFSFFSGKVITWQKTRSMLKELHYDPTGLLAIVDSSRTRDAVLASNALLLATIVSPEGVQSKLEQYSQYDMILKSKNADIFNHYVCLSAAIKQDTIVTDNLAKNLMTFKSEPILEDILCAMYSKNNFVATIKDYLVKEQNPQNELAIETALGALYSRVPPATFEKSVKGFLSEEKEKWKKDIYKNILAKKILNNYSIANAELLVIKKWDYVHSANIPMGL